MLGRGYDHNYVLNKNGDELSFAARVYEPNSGRVMEVWSTEPGLQFFSGNTLEGEVPRDVGKGGAVYAARTGFCLEPQHFPDSPNKPSFPSTVLNAGDWYRGKTVYRFSVRQ
jgi:aldose 1-epimerase